MIKIALSGKANSGKDTVSQYFEDCLFPSWKKSCFMPRKARKIAFADPIKEIILQMYPDLPREYLFGDSKFRKEIISGSFLDGQPLTIRLLSQEIGEGFKKYNPKIWIEAFDKKYQQAQKQNINLTIASDLRFIDEFNYLKANDFYLIRIKRAENEQIQHISEAQQELLSDSLFNSIIENDGTLEQLQLKVNEIAKNLIS